MADSNAQNRFPTDDPGDREPRRNEHGQPEAFSIDDNEDNPERYPGVEDAPLGFVQVDTNGEPTPPGSAAARGDRSDEAREPDFMTVGTDAGAVMDEISKYTDDEDVLADFAERQEISHGSDDLLDQLREHHGLSPDLSGDDIDAAWELSDVSGEESVGGTTPTPDQDIVEELGEALGINYADDEELQTEEKLNQRDLNRWELNPDSAEPREDEDNAPKETGDQG